MATFPGFVETTLVPSTALRSSALWNLPPTRPAWNEPPSFAQESPALIAPPPTTGQANVFLYFPISPRGVQVGEAVALLGAQRQQPDHEGEFRQHRDHPVPRSRHDRVGLPAGDGRHAEGQHQRPLSLERSTLAANRGPLRTRRSSLMPRSKGSTA